jgi:hypothetical protein
MRIRAALLITAVVAILAAPLAASTHTVNAACHGGDRVLTVVVSQGGQTLYNDDRGFFGRPDTDPVYDTIGEDTRIPSLSRADDPSGFWLYLETNQHEGLQTGGDHAVFGETGEALGFTDPCRATHNVGGASVGFDSILF